MQPFSCQNILIVRLGALGDVVHVLPALAVLREKLPESRIHWAVETASSTLLKGHPHLDHVHVIPRKEWSRALLQPFRWPGIGREVAGQVKTLRQNRIDLAIDFQGNLRSAVVAFLSGAPVRVGFEKGANKENSHVFYSHRVTPLDPRLHKVDKNLSLLHALGFHVSKAPQATLPAGEEDEAIRRDLAGMTRPLVAIHPFVSRFGALKAYPSPSFVAVAKAVAKQSGGTVLLTFGPGEREAAERMAQEAGVVLAPESGSLRGLIALFRAVDAVCGVDTGPTQLAGAAGSPVAALFGPKDPEIYKPVGERVEVVTAQDASLACIPCNGRRCPNADESGFSPCMTAIPPEAVVKAILRLLV
ncbi:MAG: glycosyltransferase family 9 protein [Planctomycetota bacterium]